MVRNLWALIFVLLWFKLGVCIRYEAGLGWNGKFVDRRREVWRTGHLCVVWCNWKDCDRKILEGVEELVWEFNEEVGLNSRRSFLEFIDSLTHVLPCDAKL